MSDRVVGQDEGCKPHLIMAWIEEHVCPIAKVAFEHEAPSLVWDEREIRQERLNKASQIVIADVFPNALFGVHVPVLVNTRWVQLRTGSIRIVVSVPVIMILSRPSIKYRSGVVMPQFINRNGRHRDNPPVIKL